MARRPRKLLTDDEHAAMEKLGDVYRYFSFIIGQGSPVADRDLHEASFHIHALQNMILAQAGARAYPDKYRLMGNVL